MPNTYRNRRTRTEYTKSVNVPICFKSCFPGKVTAFLSTLVRKWTGLTVLGIEMERAIRVP